MTFPCGVRLCKDAKQPEVCAHNGQAVRRYLQNNLRLGKHCNRNLRLHGFAGKSENTGQVSVRECLRIDLRAEKISGVCRCEIRSCLSRNGVLLRRNAGTSIGQRS